MGWIVWKGVGLWVAAMTFAWLTAAGNAGSERSSAEAGAAFMGRYAWANRPVLVFAASADAARYREQRERFLAAMDGFRERDMVWIAVFADEARVGLEEHQAVSVAPRALRSRYDVGRGRFALVLVGKDASVKRRSSEVVDARTIFEQIDGMPMRQREMERDSSE